MAYPIIDSGFGTLLVVWDIWTINDIGIQFFSGAKNRNLDATHPRSMMKSSGPSMWKSPQEMKLFGRLARSFGTLRTSTHSFVEDKYTCQHLYIICIYIIYIYYILQHPQRPAGRQAHARERIGSPIRIMLSIAEILLMEKTCCTDLRCTSAPGLLDFFQQWETDLLSVSSRIEITIIS